MGFGTSSAGRLWGAGKGGTPQPSPVQEHGDMQQGLGLGNRAQRQPQAAHRVAGASAATTAALALDVAGALAATPAAAAAPASTLSAAPPGEAATTAGATAATRATAATAAGTTAATAGRRGCGCRSRTRSRALGRPLGKAFGGSRTLLGGHGGAQLVTVNLEDKKPFTH